MSYFSRTQINILYIIGDMVLGVKVAKPELVIVKVDYIVLVVMGVFFLWELSLQIRELIGVFINFKKRKAKERKR